MVSPCLPDQAPHVQTLRYCLHCMQHLLTSRCTLYDIYDVTLNQAEQILHEDGLCFAYRCETGYPSCRHQKQYADLLMAGLRRAHTLSCCDLPSNSLSSALLPLASMLCCCSA